MAFSQKFRLALVCEAGFNTGTYSYSINIAEQLNALGHDVTLITPIHIEGIKTKQLVLNSWIFKIPLIGRASWLMSLYFRLYNTNFDIIQSSWYGMMDMLPWDIYKKKLKITTLFDVAGDNKQFREGQAYLFFVVKILQPPHLRFNDFIITSSYRSKDQIIKLKNIPANKVAVTHLGVTDRFKKVTDKKKLEKVKKKLSLPDKFILNVGGIKITRNSLGTIKAFSIIAKKHPDMHLVFAGKLRTKNPSKYHREILKYIQSLDKDVSSRIKFLNYVNDDDLPALYSLSILFLMPSLEEGFGLPLLEAMRTGCVCVTSKISSMPEIAGDATLLCDPYNIKDIAKNIEKALNNKQLCMSLSKMAESRAKTFSWEKTAKETDAIYQKEWKKKFTKI